MGESIIVTNRSGQHSSVPESVLEALAGAPQGSVLDGELVTSGGDVAYWVFDLLQFGSSVFRDKGYLERYQDLDALVSQLAEPVRLVPLATTSKDKRALFDRLSKARAEGIVFKQQDAPYTAAGRRQAGPRGSTSS